MLTITQALAEIKTIVKRIEKKREYIVPYLARNEAIHDPLAKDGGSQEVIRRELQAISDLEQRVVDLRRAILQTNLSTSLTIQGTTRTIQDWLTWRREVSKHRKEHIARVRATIIKIRQEVVGKGGSVGTAVSQDPSPSKMVVNVDEGALMTEADTMERILGELDGMLSMKNATTEVGIEALTE